jgi:hypothetical protein
MARWEYCRIDWMVRETSEHDTQDLEQGGLQPVVRSIGDGETLVMLGNVYFLRTAERVAITDLSSAITQLGLDGWELVSHTELQHPAQIEMFYFKRQIPA